MRALLLPLLLVVACDAPTVECECAVEDAPCERCAPIAVELCVEGACVARGADAVDVEATFSIDRDLDGVNGMAWAIAAGSECVAFDSFEGFQALASGQKTLTGGDFHPDLGLARVPEGPVLVLALGTSEVAGDGDVLGSGCVSADAVAPRLDLEIVEIR